MAYPAATLLFKLVTTHQSLIWLEPLQESPGNGVVTRLWALSPIVTCLAVTHYGLTRPQSDIHSSDQSYELCMIILIIICMALGAEPRSDLLVGHSAWFTRTSSVETLI